jgi:hypothetical protein
VSFPEFGRDADVVHTASWLELIPTNLHPVFRLRNAGCVLRIDAQPQGRAPQKVSHKAHSSAIVCEDPRTRSFQALLGQDCLIRFEVEVHLEDAIRPNDASDVGRDPDTEAEVSRPPRQRLLLSQQSRADLHLAARAERVDALISR